LLTGTRRAESGQRKLICNQLATGQNHVQASSRAATKLFGGSAIESFYKLRDRRFVGKSIPLSSDVFELDGLSLGSCFSHDLAVGHVKSVGNYCHKVSRWRLDCRCFPRNIEARFLQMFQHWFLHLTSYRSWRRLRM
jgi:hypothetical protein